MREEFDAKKICYVKDNKGNNCTGEVTNRVIRKGERLFFCNSCYRSYMNRTWDFGIKI